MANRAEEFKCRSRNGRRTMDRLLTAFTDDLVKVVGIRRSNARSLFYRCGDIWGVQLRRYFGKNNDVGNWKIVKFTHWVITVINITKVYQKKLPTYLKKILI